MRTSRHGFEYTYSPLHVRLLVYDTADVHRDRCEWSVLEQDGWGLVIRHVHQDRCRLSVLQQDWC